MLIRIPVARAEADYDYYSSSLVVKPRLRKTHVTGMAFVTQPLDKLRLHLCLCNIEAALKGYSSRR